MLPALSRLCHSKAGMERYNGLSLFLAKESATPDQILGCSSSSSSLLAPLSPRRLEAGAASAAARTYMDAYGNADNDRQKSFEAWATDSVRSGNLGISVAAVFDSSNSLQPVQHRLSRIA